MIEPLRRTSACAISLVSLVVLAAAFAGQTATNTQPTPLRFVPFGEGLPTSGEWREGFRIADLNGDGHPDIVHGPPRKQPGPPVIFLGDGKGSWTRWKDANFPSLSYDYGDIEVADFNRDGHMDLAVAVRYRGILVLLGDGHGGFSKCERRLGIRCGQLFRFFFASHPRH
jgi:FG-GAP-like repeat